MVLFSVFLFTVHSQNKLANRVFSVFLLITALDLSGLFLNWFFIEHPALMILKISSSLLQMPFFFIYVLAICYSDFKIEIKHFAHAVLFFIFLVLFKMTSVSEQNLIYFRIVAEVQYFAYIFAIIYTLKKYKTIYLENYSNADYSGYKWLFQITIFFCFAHIFVMLKVGALFLGLGENYIKFLYILISISALLVICWFVLKALYNPHLFTGINTELVSVEATVEKRETYPEKDEEILVSIESLSRYMETEKPYLDFDLSLEKLASNLDMPEKELSILVNHHLGKHFFDFINEYRIAEAKKILENPENKKLTILEILYEVGFNSKSSFYTAFKKYTGQTPTAFRKLALAGQKLAN